LFVSLFAILLPFVIVFLGISVVVLAFWWLFEMQRRDMLERRGYR
jgi:hypothetical protein